MAEPYPSSLIGILRGGLHLIERSTYVRSNSPALEKLRDAVDEIIAEIEVVSKEEQEDMRRLQQWR